MEKILILGAQGFIGKNLVNFLHRKYLLTAYDKVTPNKSLQVPGVQYITGDFKNETKWKNIVLDIDYIIHLVSTTNANSQTADIEKEILENVIPTVRLLEEMSKSKVKKLIFASSGGTVYGNSLKVPIIEAEPLVPVCPYGVQKKTIESYLALYNHLYNTNAITLRISNPYGIGQGNQRNQGIIPIFLSKVLNNESISIWGDGLNVRDYIYMHDLMTAFLKVLNYTGNKTVFNVGTGVGYSIIDIINIIKKIVPNHNIVVEHLPARTSDIRTNILDASLLNQETGWSPTVSLEQGILNLYHELISQAH